MLGSVDLVSIPSRDPDRARSFYIDTLGLRADEHARFEFWCGSTCFCIWQPERIGWGWAPQKNGHIAFHVDDVAAARAELEAKGSSLPAKPSTRGFAIWRSSPIPTATTACCTAGTRPGADGLPRSKAGLSGANGGGF
jgi:predicted enzyme related to lactoylglutathione lyase